MTRRTLIEWSAAATAQGVTALIKCSRYDAYPGLQAAIDAYRQARIAVTMARNPATLQAERNARIHEVRVRKIYADAIRADKATARLAAARQARHDAMGWRRSRTLTEAQRTRAYRVQRRVQASLDAQRKRADNQIIAKLAIAKHLPIEAPTD